MKFIQKLRKNYEDKIVARAKKIEEERLRLVQERKTLIEQEGPEEQQRKDKLLRASIPEDYILKLKRMVGGKDGNAGYLIYDYFLCDTKRKDIRHGNKYKVIKVSGTNLGKQFELYVKVSPVLPSLTQVELNCDYGYWNGYTSENLFIPDDCKTIADLNNYINNENEKHKKEYEEERLKKQQDEQQILNQFFK